MMKKYIFRRNSVRKVVKRTIKAISDVQELLNLKNFKTNFPLNFITLI